MDVLILGAEFRSQPLPGGLIWTYKQPNNETCCSLAALKSLRHLIQLISTETLGMNEEIYLGVNNFTKVISTIRWQSQEANLVWAVSKFSCPRLKAEMQEIEI